MSDKMLIFERLKALCSILAKPTGKKDSSPDCKRPK